MSSLASITTIVVLCACLAWANAAKTSCPTGWALKDEKCYIAKTASRISFGAADSECKKLNANLVSIHGWEEQNFIESLLTTTGSWHVGAIQKSVGSFNAEWSWSDGSPYYMSELSFNIIDDGIPTFDNTGLIFERKGSKIALHPAPNSANGYICKAEATEPTKPPKTRKTTTTTSTKTTLKPTTTKPKKPVCPKNKNWKKYEGNCYLIEDSMNVLFAKANEKCKKLKANLVSIHSNAEQKFIVNLLKREREFISGTWHTGAIKEGKNWKWSDNSKFNKYVVLLTYVDLARSLEGKKTGIVFESDGKNINLYEATKTADGYICKTPVIYV